MTRRRPDSSDANDANQLWIDWSAKSNVSEETAAAASRAKTASELVQRLPWDFRESFPPPTPEAIDAGIISDEDTEPESIKAIHQEHGRQLLATLRDLDFIREARRQGFDPKTGRPPTSPAGMERLQKLFATEPDRIERWWQTLIETYGESFGADAADAFGKAIRARHAGIEVVAETRPISASLAIKIEPAQPPPTMATEPNPLEVVATKKPEARRSLHPRTLSARFPVPRPLRAAVNAGHFGNDEHGVVNPTAAEVRAITLDHSEYLIELLQAIAQAGPTASSEELARLNDDFRTGITAYAGDFGPTAGQQLEAFVRRQAYLRLFDSPGNGRYR